MPDEPGKAIDPVVMARAAWETLVFAPIGLGAKFVDDAPGAVKRVRQELSNARFIGRLTVEQGAARLRAQASTDARSDRPDTDDHSIANTVIANTVIANTVIANTVIASTGIDALPIERYDEMPAIEIVAMLEALTPAQRSTIEAHERANRQRRTVLGKIAQLRT